MTHPPHILPLEQRSPLALSSEDREAMVMWRMRCRTVQTQLWQLLTGARLRTTLVVGLSIIFWLGLFFLFYVGFKIMVDNVGAPGKTPHATTVSFIFHLFFASLNVMLVFSSGIILYSGLFNSPETRLLLTLPVRDERIAIYKFQEAVFFSSWGFFLLASPLMISYGIVVGAPWYYYALLLPLTIAFVYIPCSGGALICLWIIHRLPQMRRVIVALAAVAVICIAGRSIWQTVDGPSSMLFGPEWFQETLNRFELTRGWWLPSTRLVGGLLESARGASSTATSDRWSDLPVIKSCLYLVVLISNALLCHLIVVWVSRRSFRSGYSQYTSRYNRRGFNHVAWIDRVANWLLQLWPTQTRLILLKDWRLLRRDPVQWSQFLIFFGLLGLYLLNIDRFSSPDTSIGFVTWINMVSFLNLAVVGLILSTFTTRFIYPMISLEGQCFWVLGLLPMQRDTILWSKFVFAAAGSWVACSVLILLSDMMLRVSGMVIAIHQLTCILLCLGLSSIAVGLGAMMPNFKERSPSKISAGFGGTLNLVLSALYIISIVVLTALPTHFFLIADRNHFATTLFDPADWKFWLVAGISAAITLGAVATVLPLFLGLRAFRRLEFF